MYNVNTDCWLYNALSLGRYEDDATTEGFIPVPAELLWIALGRAFVTLDNGPAGWYATDSAPSDTLLNSIATDAKAKGFATDDSGGQVEFATAWHLCTQLAKFVRDNVDYSEDDSAFLLSEDEQRFNASCASFTAVCSRPLALNRRLAALKRARLRPVTSIGTRTTCA